MNNKKYSMNDITRIINNTTSDVLEQYYEKMDMGDIGLLNTFVWELQTHLKDYDVEKEE